MNPLPERDANRVSLLWAGAEHAVDISALHKALFPIGWDTESVSRSLEAPGATSLIGTTGWPKVLVGFILGQIAADEAEILSIGVAPEWQRHGVGAKLVEGIVRAATRAQAKRLYLEVAADNRPAQALYAKMGFTETGRRKGYYQRPSGPAVDALLLAKPL